MKIALCAVLALFVCTHCFGQQQSTRLNNDTTAYSYGPLLIIRVANKPVIKSNTMELINLINKNDINAVYVTENADSLKKYGTDARYGILDIRTNDKVDIANVSSINFSNIQKNYHLKADHLPVYVDNKLVIHTERISILQQNVLTAKIYKDQASGKEYINIITSNAEMTARSRQERYIR